MAVSYNRHRRKVDFSKHFSYKQHGSLQDDPINLSVKYVNKRCSPNRTNSGNRLSCDHNTITIIIKKKTNTEQKKQNLLKENKTTQRVQKSIASSFITIDDYLKVLAEKCSTPNVLEACVHRNQKMRCSDTCLKTSTPFKTRTLVNTVSLDPKKVPPDCKHLLNHPLMQTHLNVYRCQPKKEKETGCRTCTSAAIFEVVKCLYDCYKKKKCDHCKCVVCGYLPRDIRKLINEVGRSKASVGVETPSTTRNTRSTMTSQEKELLAMLQNEPKPEKPRITSSEKLRIAKAFGILTPEGPACIKLDRDPKQKHFNTNYMTKADAPCPDDHTPLERMLYRTHVPNEGPSIRVPSKKLRKARASGLLTSLDGKTQEQKEKILRNLAMNNIPLPEGKTESEKIVIAKVRRSVGLPPGPKTAAEKERYSKAQVAGLITPLKGKSQSQKENILRSLLENGIPLPEGRTPTEKALIEKIELDCLSKVMFRIDTEKSIRNRAKSYVQTLFNKFATEAGYMVLVETSCVKDTFHNLQVKGLLSPIEGKAKKDIVKRHLIRPKETKSLEKALFEEVEIGVRLVPDSQRKTQIEKILQGPEKECVQLCDRKMSVNKSIIKQTGSSKFLEERITQQREKLSPGIAVAGNPFLKDKMSFENLLVRILKDKAKESNIISEIIQKPKGRKSESELTLADKRSADARVSLTEDYVLLKRENINKLRDTTKILEKQSCKTRDVGTAIPQKVSNGMVTNLETHIKKRLDDKLVSATMCKRSDINKLSYQNRYLTIKLPLSDISTVSAPKETYSVFTDTKDIKQTRDIGTSLPSTNSTTADKCLTLDEKPTKEIKKRKNNIKSADNDSLISLDTNSTTADNDSKSTFYFKFVDDTDNASQSPDNTYEKNYEENNADLIYIYKPTLELDRKEKLTASSQLILTDSYNITPNSSGSLYLIETGSTTSNASALTDFSSTKDSSDTGTGTDVYYIMKSEEEHTKDASSEPRTFWYYRNKVIHNLPGKDANIYLVSEVKMRQERKEPAQLTKKQLDLKGHWNGSPSRLETTQTTSRQNLGRSSSIFIVMSPSNHDELSSEELGSLIYIGKLDSVSKLKTIKLVPHENTQKVPIKMCRRHTRNEEHATKSSVAPKATLKCSGSRPERPRHTSHAPPVTNAFTRHTCNTGLHDRGNRLEYPAAPIQQQRIPPKYLEIQKMTAGHAKWNKELHRKLSSCSIACRLNPEQRMGYPRKQQMGPINFEVNVNKTGPLRESKVPTCKAIDRNVYCDKNYVYRDKPNKSFPDERVVTKSSKVCLIATTHSSKYRIHSEVSFSDQLKKIKRDKLSKPCKDKCLDPKSKKFPPQNPKECKNSQDDSSRWSYDDKAKRNREKQPPLTIKISTKVSSKSSIRAPSNKGSKVRFDHRQPSCCPCELPKKDLRPCGHEKKALQLRGSYCSKQESKQCDEKNELKLCDDEKKELKPCDDEKKETKLCESEKVESKALIKEKKESKPCVSQKKEFKPCVREKKESKTCDVIKKKISETFEKVKKKISSEATVAATASKERRCEENTKKYLGVCSPQPSTAKQSNLSKGCSSQCRESVKRATSPLNVKVKSVGVDGSHTCKPTGAGISTGVCPEKEQTPEKNRSQPCGPGRSVDTKDNRGVPTKDSADNPKESECQLDDENTKLCQQKALGSHVNSIQDSKEQSTAECIKQQMVTQQCCPPNSTSNEQLCNECVKLNQQMASACPKNLTQDAIEQPVDESAQDSIKLPAAEPVKCIQEMTPKCLENSPLNSISQSCNDNDKLSQPTAPECPENSTQDSISEPVDEDVKLNQETTAKCPANSTQGSNEIANECLKSQQIVSEQCPPKSSQDFIQQPDSENERLNQKVPVPCSVRGTKKRKKYSIFPREQRGSKCISKSQEMEQRYSNTGSAETPCTHEEMMQDSDNKIGPLWWCKKKRQIIFRRHSRPPAPPPPRLIEEKTAETQCERDVRDLAQMTDNLEQMTDSLRDLTQCHCGDTVKPCQCLQELVTQSMTPRRVLTAKTASKCECPPPIIIIKGQTTSEQNEKEVNRLKQILDQQSDCPCIDYLEKHKNKPCQCPARLERAQSIAPHVSKRKVCECPPMHFSQLQNKSESGHASKNNVTCECSPPTATGQDEENGTCQGMASEQDGKKKIGCGCSQPMPVGTVQSQNGKNGTCQGMAGDQGKDIKYQCPRPTNIVTEQPAAVQCQKEPQPKRDTFETCQGKQIQAQNKTQNIKKTVICEKPSKDKFKLLCPDDKKPTYQKDQKKGGPRKKLCMNLGKKKQPTAEFSSSEESMECQKNKSSRVKWCQKKYVISECPPLPAEDPCDKSCLSPERKKQRKKNAKNQAKIGTGEKQIDTSCTHGAAACLCKDEPLNRKIKNHKCECPCPSLVEEVDLSFNIKDCPQTPACPQEDEKETNIQKTVSGECDQEQMTEGKIDKCSYTDRPVKGLCKTKNKATGRGKWGKKKLECICSPEPLTTETGCDPPCAKEQWKMRSRETHSKSGFCVKKKPAPRVDHTMCFEDALAYFEEHPEDDPMLKKKRKVTCECPPLQCCDGYGSDALQFCYARC